MKQKYRIARIWFYGHYNLIAKVRERRVCEFRKRFNLLIPDYIPKLMEKYGDVNFEYERYILGIGNSKKHPENFQP